MSDQPPERTSCRLRPVISSTMQQTVNLEEGVWGLKGNPTQPVSIAHPEQSDENTVQM